MNKRKLVFFLMPFVLIGFISLWILIPSWHKTEKLYYISPVGMYLKVVKPPLNKYGYIFFNRDSVFSLPEQADYIKVHKSETANINIIINPSIKNTLYLDDRFDFSVPHPVKYNICKINFRDTTFFEEHNVAGTCIYILKYPYICVSIDGYLESVYESDEEYSNKIEPMRE